jgi:hypothetical protein
MFQNQSVGSDICQEFRKMRVASSGTTAQFRDICARQRRFGLSSSASKA